MRPGFAANFKDTDKLSDVLAELDTPSLAKVIRSFRVRAWTPRFAQKTKEWLSKSTESSVSRHGYVRVKMARKQHVPLPAKTSEGSDMGALDMGRWTWGRAYPSRGSPKKTLCVSLNCSKTRRRRLTVSSARRRAIRA